ncbi:MAG TPA: radical SAM protein [Spirochaetia bacterium]|nr:radical SAM protein [Spirochaetia bacterium]
MACNMHCRHCGSGCAGPLPGELDTGEALRLCDDLAELGLEFVTLSGGETLLRSDWPVIARRLTDLGVYVNMISNGWLVDAQVVETARRSGIQNMGVSLDGLEATHDATRKEKAFSRAVNALELMRRMEYPSAVITTVMRQNLSQLPGIRRILEDRGVGSWQLQIGRPMGNLLASRESILDPRQVEGVIDFAASLVDAGGPRPFLADCLGYYTNNSVRLRESIFGRDATWSGCRAGKSTMGILHDGRIVGCTSLRDHRFVEGNIRETPLREIWNRDGGFEWSRSMTRAKLTGFCQMCRYGEDCLGGCSGIKFTMTGGLQENPFCAHRVKTESLFPKIERIGDVDTLLARAGKAADLGLDEIAAMCLARAGTLNPNSQAH